MLSSVTDRESDVETDKLDALQPENITKNRDTDIVPRLYSTHTHTYTPCALN